MAPHTAIVDIGMTHARSRIQAYTARRLPEWYIIDQDYRRREIRKGQQVRAAAMPSASVRRSTGARQLTRNVPRGRPYATNHQQNAKPRSARGSLPQAIENLNWCSTRQEQEMLARNCAAWRPGRDACTKMSERIALLIRL